MSEKEILKELRPAVDAAYATKSVYDKEALSKTLLNKTQELQDLVRGLEGDRPHDRTWWVDKIRLRIDVKASGMIAPALYLGAMVRFRFQWQRIKRITEKPRNFDTPTYRESSMKNFVTEMSKDLEEYETINLQNKKFYLKYIRLRVGLGVKGSVHLAKLEGSVAGAIFFTQKSKKVKTNNSLINTLPITSRSFLSTERDIEATDENYLELQDELTPTTKNLAKITNTDISARFMASNESHIVPENFRTTNKLYDSALFKVSRKKFKRGLRKSARIAKDMISMLGSADSKKWILNKAYIGFEVILTGGVGPVTLKGKPSIELRFNRRS